METIHTKDTMIRAALIKDQEYVVIPDMKDNQITISTYHLPSGGAENIDGLPTLPSDAKLIREDIASQADDWGNIEEYFLDGNRVYEKCESILKEINGPEKPKMKGYQEFIGIAVEYEKECWEASYNYRNNSKDEGARLMYGDGWKEHMHKSIDKLNTACEVGAKMYNKDVHTVKNDVSDAYYALAQKENFYWERDAEKNDAAQDSKENLIQNNKFWKIEGVAEAAKAFNDWQGAARIYLDRGKGNVWTNVYEGPDMWTDYRDKAVIQIHNKATLRITERDNIIKARDLEQLCEDVINGKGQDNELLCSTGYRQLEFEDKDKISVRNSKEKPSIRQQLAEGKKQLAKENKEKFLEPPKVAIKSTGLEV